MAKQIETPKLYTFKRAQKFLTDNGVKMSTQQVRNLARSNEVIKAGASDYTDPVTEESFRVISADALAAYLQWRIANPEGARGGRKANPNGKRYFAMLTLDQLDQANQVLTANGLPNFSIPVRTPRKSKNTNGVADTADFNGMTGNGIEDLELIDIDG